MCLPRPPLPPPRLSARYASRAASPSPSTPVFHTLSLRIFTSIHPRLRLCRLDANKDGRIDRKEFLVGMLIALELVTSEDVGFILKRFDEVDADGDGVRPPPSEP